MRDWPTAIQLLSCRIRMWDHQSCPGPVWLILLTTAWLTGCFLPSPSPSVPLCLTCSILALPVLPLHFPPMPNYLYPPSVAGPLPKSHPHLSNIPQISAWRPHLLEGFPRHFPHTPPPGLSSRLCSHSTYTRLYHGWSRNIIVLYPLRQELGQIHFLTQCLGHNLARLGLGIICRKEGGKEGREERLWEWGKDGGILLAAPPSYTSLSALPGLTSHHHLALRSDRRRFLYPQIREQIPMLRQ